MVKRRSSEVIHTGFEVSSSYKTAEPLGAGKKANKSAKAKPLDGTAAKRIRKRPQVIDATGKKDAVPVEDAAEPSAAPPVTEPTVIEPTVTEVPASPVPPEPKPAPPVVVKPAPPPAPPLEPIPRPAPKPVANPVTDIKSKSKPASPEQLSKKMATSAVTSLVEQMTAKSELNGGFLRTADIQAMEQEFHVHVSDLTQSLVQSFEEFVESREKASWDRAREFPFWRVVVKKFSHLFGEVKSGRMDTVSKRMLPGFFAGLNMMIGPESVDLYQERCRRVVDRIRDQQGGDFDWDTVYDSTEITAIVFDALMAIAPHFDNFEKRQEWLIELVNGNLAPIDDSNGDDAGWELSPAGYKRFLSALYGDLDKLLANKSAYNQIAKRYGSNALDAVKDLVRRAKGPA
jgi:hypothetical protein